MLRFEDFSRLPPLEESLADGGGDRRVDGAGDCTKLRKEGNDAFQRGDFGGAIDRYSAAILMEPRNVALLTNRAAVCF